MTTRQRIALLLPVLRQFSELGIASAASLRELLRDELGHPDALDRWIPYGSHHTRAIAPHSIYLLCAGNVAVASWQPLYLGLLLGSHLEVKIPADQRDEVTRFVRLLPDDLRSLVHLHHHHSLKRMQSADAVIALGHDKTLAEIRTHLRPSQIFLGYGHQVSLLWLRSCRDFSPQLLRHIATDICTYDQLGCLSPQAIYLSPGSTTKAFCAALAQVLALQPPPKFLARDKPAIAARIHEARALASAQGLLLWKSPDPFGYTVIFDSRPDFRLSCGYRVIYVREAAIEKLSRALASVRQKISTVGYLSPLEPAVEKVFLSLGAKRFCAIGQCQFPPPLWHHDGRPQLGDLVKWVDRQMAPSQSSRRA